MLVYKLEGHIFDEVQGVLTRNGQVIPIEPQVAKVLGILLREAGNTVSRDDLLREVWNNRSVSPGVVDNRIRAARNAIGDDGRTQRLIKTYSNEGYKFIGTVEHVEQLDHDNALQAPQAQTEISNSITENSARLWLWFSAASVVAMVSVAVIAMQFLQLFPGENQDSETTDVEKLQVEIPFHSVAVLPFVRNNAADSAPYLESLLVSILSSTPDLQVTSPRSSNRFSMVNMSAPVIGQALKTRHLITGDVRVTSEGTDVMIRLLDAQEDKIVWADSISLASASISNDVVGKAAMQRAALQVLNTLGVSPYPLQSDLISPDSAALLAQAIEILQMKRDESLKTAIELLEQVIVSEPDFLPAYEEIGMAYHLAVQYSGLEVTEAAGKINKYAELATQVSSTGRGVSMLRGLQSMYRGNLDLALSHFDKAISLDAKHKYSVVLRAEVLSLLGDVKAAEQAFQNALAFDPLSPELLSRVARANFGQQKHSDAISLARTNGLWNPGHPDAVTDLAMFQRELGHYSEAYPMLLEALEDKKNSRAEFEMLRLLHNLGKLNLFDSFHMSPEINVLAYSLAGNEVLARLAQSRDPLGIYNGFMEYTFGNKRPLYDFLSGTGRYARFTSQSVQISSEYIFDAIFYADASAEYAPEKASKILQNVETYFSKIPLSILRAEEDLLALAGLRSLQKDLPGLLLVMEAAKDRGIVFVGALEKSPVFEFARQSDEFLSALSVMKEQASDIWEAIQSGPATSQ